MRARRDLVRRWERQHDRPYLYAGPSKGAQVATWKQAARAELSAAIGVEYAQTLLDLVKAFERVPHEVLLREAIRLGYPLWVFQLSLATYRLARVVRVDAAFSSLVWATRGITAGSVHATTEMRLFIINIIDSAIASFPLVKFVAYVDDITAEAAATRRLVLRDLVLATLFVCDRLTADGAEVSTSKSFCAASNAELGATIAARLTRYGFKLRQRVKSLGTGLGAGVRRNASVAKGRLTSFRKRLRLFRRLRRARGHPAHCADWGVRRP